MSDKSIITNYLKDYWNKYPEEKNIDPSIEQFVKLARDNKYVIDHGIFIIYKEFGNIVDILYYCFDYQNNLLQTMKAHRAFISDRLVFLSDNIKPVYRRSKIIKFDMTYNKWRFI